MRLVKKALPLCLLVLVLALTFFLQPTQVRADTYDSLTYSINNGEVTITDCNLSVSGKKTIPTAIEGYPVTSIGDYAFYYCEGLTDIIIPDSVTTIGKSAFCYCTNLRSITIPDSVTSIGNYAFSGCGKLTSITIPDSVTNIGDYAFYECEKITSVSIPDSVTNIGSYAFQYCNSLTDVTIGKCVASIGIRAFTGCTSLVEIRVDANNPVYSSDRFGALYNKDKTELFAVPGGLSGRFTVADGVINIGDYAFAYCSGLTSVVIPDGAATIGQDVFAYCSSLTSITIADSVTTIGQSAFLMCNSLTSVTIGKGITSIDDYAFHAIDCPNLKTVRYTGTEEQWSAISIDSTNTALFNANIIYDYSPGQLSGDFTGDEAVTNEDVVILLWHTLFPTDYPIDSDADFNTDGFVTNEDVVYMLWHTLFPTDYPL